MAQASRKDRKLRRMKREKSLAYKMLRLAIAQRDIARELLKEEKIKNIKLEADENAQELKGGIEVIKVEENEVEQENNQTDRQDQDSSGLEMPKV